MRRNIVSYINKIIQDIQSQPESQPGKPPGVFTVGSFNCDYTTIQAAINAASSGNLILVYPGTYNEQVILKDGVDIECLGKVIISGTDAAGTIIDNNISVSVSIKGFPLITNTNGLIKRIVLTNSSSSVQDFWWEYEAYLTQNGTTAPVAVVIKNTLGASPVWSRIDIGYYRLSLAGAFPGKVFILPKYSYNPEEDVHFYSEAEVPDAVALYTRVSGSPEDSWLTYYMLSVKVCP